MPLFGDVQPKSGFRRAESGIEAKFVDYLGPGVHWPGESFLRWPVPVYR